MPYVTLGARGPVTGLPDSSGHNPGNWTITFAPDVLNVNTPQFEVYKMIVRGANNTTFDVFVDTWQWDTAVYGTKNSWDPMQPLIMRPGQYLYFCYSDATTDNTPPVATVWLRYMAQEGTVLWDGKTYSLPSFKRVTRS